MLILFMVFVIGNYQITYTHELVHQTIYSTYGIASDIVINAQGVYMSVPHFPITIGDKEMTEINALNINNDIVFYSITAFFNSLICLVFGIILIIMFYLKQTEVDKDEDI